MRRRRTTHELAFTVERGNASVDLVCQFTVTPGLPGRTYGDPGSCYPAEPPEVDDKRVFFERVVPCLAHTFRRLGCATCVDCRKLREERPEFEDLVSDEECLEYAAETLEDDYHAAADAEGDRRRDERRGL